MHFREWLDSLDRFTYQETRSKIIRQCMLEVSGNRCYRFENWKTGATVPDRIYQKIINKIAGQKLRYSQSEEEIIAKINV